jgi:hypothetical protein
MRSQTFIAETRIYANLNRITLATYRQGEILTRGVGGRERQGDAKSKGIIIT